MLIWVPTCDYYELISPCSAIIISADEAWWVVIQTNTTGSTHVYSGHMMICYKEKIRYTAYCSLLACETK